MKLKINKACDLSSISVLPPHARRSNTAPTGPQRSQLRSQTSQQSFSQGLSSQHGIFSQFTQSSLEEAPINDQRFGSQERENSLKKVSCLPSGNYTREESQMPMSRSSTNLMRRWNPPSVPDHKSQISEELELRLGMIETSLNRFGMIMESVQSDVMQVNKATKEVSLETESIRQKLILHETLLQTINKGQADIKSSIDGGIKCIFDQLNEDSNQDRLRQISLMLSTIPEQMETSLRKLQTDLCSTFTREMQAMASLKTPNQKGPVTNVLPRKVTGGHTTQTQRRLQQPNNPAEPSKDSLKTNIYPKIEVGSWKSVKVEEGTCRKRATYKEQRQQENSSSQLFKMQKTICRVIIESDEEIDRGFCCLLNEKERGNTGNNFTEEANQETERILKRARRTKRQYCNPIIIN